VGIGQVTAQNGNAEPIFYHFNVTLARVWWSWRSSVDSMSEGLILERSLGDRVIQIGIAIVCEFV
jgi:hypothetical protein